MKNKKFQDAFIELLRSERTKLSTSSEIFNIIEEYVCRIYSLETKNDINNGRFELFEKSYKCNNDNEQILKKK